MTVHLPPWHVGKSKVWNHGDIIILQMCTINDNHMMYGSWDMEHNRQTKIMTICYTVPEKRHVTDVIFISHSGLFFVLLPLPPSLMTQKIKILKKWKKTTTGDIIILYMCNKNYYHMMYSSWDMVYNSFKLEMNITESHFFKELTMNRKLKWFFLSFWVTFEFFVFSVVTELLTAHKGQCFIF